MSISEKLSISLVQTDLYWKDKTANLAMLEEKIWSIESPTDLIVLPEMFPTGFSMDAEELAEPMNLTVCRWMKQQAAQTQAVITGSAIILEKGGFYNRLLWATPSGEIHTYDKKHLFRMAGEDAVFSEGKLRPSFDLKGWKICPQVCYDLRFPVFSRNSWRNDSSDYDLIFYIASWPKARASAWDTLLPARAIENLSYSLGVNRIGKDGNGIDYIGGSAVFDFKGENLLDLENNEKIGQVTLDYEALKRYREKFPAWRDRDDFQVY